MTNWFGETADLIQPKVLQTQKQHNLVAKQGIKSGLTGECFCDATVLGVRAGSSRRTESVTPTARWRLGVFMKLWGKDGIISFIFFFF